MKPNESSDIHIKSSQIVYGSRFLIAICMLSVAGYFFFRDNSDLFFAVMYASTGLFLLIVSALSKRVFVRSKGEKLTVQTLMTQRAVDISKLTDVSYLPGRNGGLIILKNSNNQVIKIVTIFSKTDTVDLFRYLQTYVTKPGVSRNSAYDQRVAKLGI